MRDKAMQVLKQYTKSNNLIKHGIAVEGAMRQFAKVNNEDVEYWGAVGLLHDVDYELYPSEHLQHSSEILLANGYDEKFVRHINAHGYGLCTDVEPIEFMEKVLYTIDELTGLIVACALISPEKKLSSVAKENVIKKWKKKDFASGVKRPLIESGALMLNMNLEDVIEQTIIGVQSVADQLGL